MTKQKSRTVQVNVPGETCSLALVRKIVTHLASSAGFPEIEVDKIEIAVDEACTNAMEHAYRAMSPKPHVEIHINVSEGHFTVDVIDRGNTFDFAAYNPPTFPEHWNRGNTRGLGLYLIKQFMDEINYERISDTENRLRLVKHVHAACPVGQ
jgi:anti-sigma regulatory factor (Ser/Thr protein kinase)